MAEATKALLKEKKLRLDAAAALEDEIHQTQAQVAIHRLPYLEDRDPAKVVQTLSEHLDFFELS